MTEPYRYFDVTNDGITQEEADALYKEIGYVPEWEEITDKPATYPPSSHSHAKLDRLPDAETSQRVVYVSPTGSDSAGDGSSANRWATIQYAVDQSLAFMQPRNGASAYKIVCATGTYVEQVRIPPNTFAAMNGLGQGGIWITSETGNADDVIITCTPNPAPIWAYGSFSLEKITLAHDHRSAHMEGNAAVTGFVYACVLRRASGSDGGDAALAANFGLLISYLNSSPSGQRFAYGLKAQNGAVIAKNATQPLGATANEITASGGVIR